MCELQEIQFKRKEEKCKIGLGTERNWNRANSLSLIVIAFVYLEYKQNSSSEVS